MPRGSSAVSTWPSMLDTQCHIRDRFPRSYTVPRSGAPGPAQPAIAQPGVGLGSPRPDTTGDVHVVLGDLVGDLLPLARAPTLRGRDEGRVEAQVHEGRQPLQPEALDERVVVVTAHDDGRCRRP